MSRKLKPLLAVCLVASLLLSFAALPASAASATPVVCVTGEGDISVTREDGTVYMPRAEYADSLVESVVPELAPVFAKAVLTGDYTAWSAQALEALSPIYDEIRPNPDGTWAANTSANATDVSQTPWPDENGVYLFGWDFRRSPLDVADDLKIYIEKVKAQTGKDKVSLSSRCAGSAVHAAYLAKYGAADIACNSFVCNALHGFDFADVAMSGNVVVSGAALQRYVQQKDLLGGFDETIVSFLMATLQEMNKNASADDMLAMIMKIYDKIKDPFIAPFLRMFYGISPGYVAMVDEHYDQYKDYVFPTEELKEEYAPILAMTDAYHETVQNQIDEILKTANDNGSTVYFIAYYGEQQYPVSPLCEYVGDELACIQDQSFGATAAKVTEQLPASYIKAQKKAGLERYISPDRQIDASTCMYPDQTFFIKNMRHSFDSDLLNFLKVLANNEGMTVNTLPAYPQFLNRKADHTALEPAQETNANDVQWKELETPEPEGPTGFFVNVLAFFAQILSTFRSLITMIKTLFGIA